MRLNGDNLNTEAGIVQDRFDITDEVFTPSQLVVSCKYVLEEVWINSLYPVIATPPVLLGRLHATMMLFRDASTVVVGALG